MSNSLCSISFNKCGTSIVAIPLGFRISFIPSTKSFRFGTCAKTLFPIIRSAIFFSLISLFASFVPKNSLIVDIPLLLAILATFLAGSIPKMGIFFF